MKRLAFEQPCHGLQPDVGMRRDVEPTVLGDCRGPDVVDEAPGTDRAPSRRGSARRTAIRPTSALRLSMISTHEGRAAADRSRPGRRSLSPGRSPTRAYRTDELATFADTTLGLLFTAC